jgi:hypothetical protein
MKIFLVLVSILLLLGCAGGTAQNPLTYLYPANEKSVCTAPEYQASVICKIMTQLGETPEQFNDQLLDVSIVGLMTKMWDKDQLKKAISLVRQFTAAEADLSMSKLLGFLQAKSEEDQYLKMMLSRKLDRLKIPQFWMLPFTPQDKAMVIYALDSQEAQL